MANEEKKLQEFNPAPPETEEEEPFETSKIVKPRKKGRTKPIDEKDNRAFWLTCGCLALLAIFCGIDVFTERDIGADSQTLSSFIDILKYVITTSLGFFFATTVNQKE